MATIKFDDFLKEELKNDEFKAGYLAEKAILESALAVYNARQKLDLLNVNWQTSHMFHSLP